jgi:hypothetical protein
MYISFSLLLLAASFPTDGAQPETIAKGPNNLQGKVLDVFDGNQLLLSIGADQGARKGLAGSTFRSNPYRDPLLAEVEFVEVGAKHSVVRVRYNAYLPGRFRIGESFVWMSFQRPARPLEGDFQRFPLKMQAGGATIDFTTPNGAKFLPPRKQ